MSHDSSSITIGVYSNGKSHRLLKLLFLKISSSINVQVYYYWQSRVEIEGYSVVYFDRIAAFKAPYR